MTVLLQFNDLLQSAGYEPGGVVVLRHRPWEPKLRQVFSWLAAERPALYDEFQSSHGPVVEKTLTKAAYLASFIGHQPGQAVFVGLYEVKSWQPVDYDTFWASGANQQLRELGMAGFLGDRPAILRFDLVVTDFCAEWKGRLVCAWSGERSWCRWAGKNRFPVHAIHEQSLLVGAMPDWHAMSLSWPELNHLPSSWKLALAQWRGIYFIYDKLARMAYVGSAYGADNLLGRWLNYAASGHGGNRLLRGRNPEEFVFSILQRVSPDMDADDVVAIENSWKERLHTHAPDGLNDN